MHDPFPANSLPTDDELQNAFIGKNNTSYYRIAFARMQEYGSLASGWNWVAFFFTSWRLIYRRLWGIWFIYEISWLVFALAGCAATALSQQT